jgi:two-component system, cell cycle sensor histidine kinase and response regulator CckA
MHGKTVIVVEDEPDVRRVAVRLLSRNGFTVIQYGDPLQALSELQGGATQADLLLTDMIMPQMTGQELAERLGLPTVFMSGYQAIVNTWGGLLDKPFTENDLLDAVWKELGERRPTKAGAEPARSET